MNFEKWPYFSKGFKDVSEAQLLYDYCISRRPQTILEIGRRFGISTRLFATAAWEWSGHIISIDGAPKEHVPRMLEKLGLLSLVTFIDQWSPWVPFNPEWEIDLLYIDGDHTYISTLVDYHVFNFFVPTDGLIVFHDRNHKPVEAAISAAVRRDRLKHIESAGELSVYQKIDKPRRVYYQFPNVEFETI